MAPDQGCIWDKEDVQTMVVPLPITAISWVNALSVCSETFDSIPLFWCKLQVLVSLQAKDITLY